MAGDHTVTSQESYKCLAKSLVCIFCLMASGSLTTDSSGQKENGHEMLEQALRWASVVSLMAAVYYMQYQLWRKCYRKKK
jgi:hypothetical protein